MREVVDPPNEQAADRRRLGLPRLALLVLPLGV
jgi:hypothetical protein